MTPISIVLVFLKLIPMGAIYTGAKSTGSTPTTIYILRINFVISKPAAFDPCLCHEEHLIRCLIVCFLVCLFVFCCIIYYLQKGWTEKDGKILASARGCSDEACTNNGCAKTVEGTVCLYCCNPANGNDNCNNAGFVKPSIVFMGAMIALILAILRNGY